MGWVSASLKIPDDGDWVALTNVTSDGQASIMGYIERYTLERMLSAAEELVEIHESWIDEARQRT